MNYKNMVLACLQVSLLAQTPAATPDPAQHFVAGGQWSSAASPKFLAFAAGAQSLGNGTYNWNGFYATASGGKITNSVTAGIAQHLRDFMIFKFYVLGAVGAAQTSGPASTSLGLALNSGVLTVIPLRKSRYTVDVLTQAIRTPTGTNTTVAFGFGVNSSK